MTLFLLLSAIANALCCSTRLPHWSVYAASSNRTSFSVTYAVTSSDIFFAASFEAPLYMNRYGFASSSPRCMSSTHSPRTAIAFAPPMPTAPQTAILWLPLFHSSVFVQTVIAQPGVFSSSAGSLWFMVGTKVLFSSISAVLITFATPAAMFVCPILDFTEPIFSGLEP